MIRMAAALKQICPILLVALFSGQPCDASASEDNAIRRRLHVVGRGGAVDGAGLSADWVTTVRDRIRESEYHITPGPRGETYGADLMWQAPNRSHGFRTHFLRDGIRVVPRAPSKPNWEWGLTLVGYGRGSRLSTPEAPTHRPSGNRIAYDRGALMEWYINDDRGLEQGFDLLQAPAGPRAQPVVIVLRLQGALAADLLAGGQAVEFIGPSGVRVLRYADLNATDAAGRRLDARMEIFSENGNREVRLVVDDAGATYPVRLNPLTTSPSWAVFGGQSGANLGVGAATAGDVNGDGFSDIVVGAPGYDHGESDEGRIFVYHGGPLGPAATPDWTAESDQVGAGLGGNVRTAGDVNGDGFGDLVVSAASYDTDGADDGLVLVFHGSSSGLDAGGTRTAGNPANADRVLDGPQSGAFYGVPVATAGDVNGDGYSDLLIGSPFYSKTVNSREGRAYLHLGSPTGVSIAPHWMVEGNAAGDNLGFDASSAGDVNGDGYSDVVIDARFHDGGNTNEGAIFVFHGFSGGLPATPDWTAEANQDFAAFGVSAAAAGDVNGDGYGDLIVSAHFYDNPEVDEGAAFLFLGSSTGLDAGGARPSGNPANADWMIESDAAGESLGFRVGSAGDVNGDGFGDVLIGSHLFDGMATDTGRILVYLGSASGPAATPDWSVEGEQGASDFAWRVETAGDVNGDGCSDIIAGARYFSDTFTNEGKAYLYLGSPSGVLNSARWMIEGAAASEYLGYAASTAGDVNGDGYSDVLVGSRYYDGGMLAEGMAALYLGGPGGPSLTPDWQVEGGQEMAYMGHAVASAGDVNGDGYSDIVVGLPGYNLAPYDHAGRVFAYYGSPSGPQLVPDWTGELLRTEIHFGESLDSAGDVNGDGFSDLIVGTSRYDLPAPRAGGAWVYHGSPEGLRKFPAWSSEGGGQAVWWGFSVASGGDVNGDGYSDVIIGAPRWTDGEPNEGAAFVFHGSPTGLGLGGTRPVGSAANADWHLQTDRADSRGGWSVDTAGDVNGDGYSDIIVGFPTYEFDPNTFGIDTGAAAVYHGSATGLDQGGARPVGSFELGTWDWGVIGVVAQEQFGETVATAGDVDGDGFSDVIMGITSSFTAGWARLARGSSGGLGYPDFLLTQPEGSFGKSVASAGDVNGDGFADVLVGSLTAGTSQAGRFYLYYGGGLGGVTARPTQERFDATGPIAPLGKTDEPDAFRTTLVGRSPFGRGKVRLEAEVKPLGVPFDGTGIVTTPGWLDTGVSGTQLDEVIPGLAGDTPHHWRARVVHDAVTTPLLPAGRWMSMPWNGWEESDLRTPGTADLEVVQSDASDPIAVGDDLVYHISILNNGPAASDVLFKGTKPPGTTIRYVISTRGTCYGTPWDHACELGPLAPGESADVTVSLGQSAAGVYTHDVTVTGTNFDPDLVNVSSEDTTVIVPEIGDRVWLDVNLDGIQDAGEAGVTGVLVALYDGTGLLDATTTDATGMYRFTNLTLGETYQLRFFPEATQVFTWPGVGGDRDLDSDVVDATAGSTSWFTLMDGGDATQWDAGLVWACTPPDEPIYLPLVTLSTDGNDYPILHFMDGNQPLQVTGYNVYRSPVANLPPASWTLVASDVVDMDAGTPNHQWIDTSGDIPPGGIWFYQVAAFNHRCPAEGPW